MYKRASKFCQSFFERNGRDLRSRVRADPRRREREIVRRSPAPPKNAESKEEAKELRTAIESTAAGRSLAALREMLVQGSGSATSPRKKGAIDRPEQQVQPLSVEEAELIANHLKFYEALADGSRTPATEAQSHFLKVVGNVEQAVTPHERAYMKWRRLQKKVAEKG